jgi:hypothetical protein
MAGQQATKAAAVRSSAVRRPRHRRAVLWCKNSNGEDALRKGDSTHFLYRPEAEGEQTGDSGWHGRFLKALFSRIGRGTGGETMGTISRERRRCGR